MLTAKVLSDIKNELEDLSRISEKRKFYETAKLVEKRKAERDEQVQRMIADISAMMEEHHIKC